MQFVSNDEEKFTALRSVIANAIADETMSAGDRRTLASVYWEASIRKCIAAHDYEGAWHRTLAAAFGKDVFTGPDRICRPLLEGELVGLIAPPKSIMEFIHLLYYAMQRDEQVDGARNAQGRRAWGPLFQSGNRMSLLMDKHPPIPYLLASTMAVVIAEWTNNHRRLANVA